MNDVLLLIERGGKRLGLSPQQIRVVVLLAGGLRSKEVAKEMQLTARTVDTYVTHMFAKLEIDNRVVLVLKCVQAGLNDGD